MQVGAISETGDQCVDAWSGGGAGAEVGVDGSGGEALFAGGYAVFDAGGVVGVSKGVIEGELRREDKCEGGEGHGRLDCEGWIEAEILMAPSYCGLRIRVSKTDIKHG